MKKEKSIMHKREDATCYLCMKLDGNYAAYPYLEGHHVIYNARNRKLSDKYGLIIYLCNRHHADPFSSVAVHNNKSIREMTCIDAQIAFEKANPDKSFISIFGKNYLDPEDREKPQEYKAGEGFEELGDVLNLKGRGDLWSR